MDTLDGRQSASCVKPIMATFPELADLSPAPNNTVASDHPTLADVNTDSSAASARMADIHEMLEYASMNVLQRSELIAEYAQLAERVGQDGPPAGGCQPFDRGIRRAARELAFLGKTESARRKIISRALGIAEVSATAKTAVVAAGLENRQSALLAIASERTPERQLEKIGEITARRQASRRRREPGPTGAGTTEAADVGLGASVVPELSPDRDGSIVPAQVRFDPDTAYAELMSAWKASPEFQRLWRRSPRIIREQFIDFLRRQETDEIVEASPNATNAPR